MAEAAPDVPADLLPGPGRTRPPSAVIVGPGRSGKTDLLSRIGDAWSVKGVAVTSLAGRRLEEADDGAALDGVLGHAEGSAPALARDLAAALEPAPWMLLVDDGQWLDPLSVRVIAALAERASQTGGGVVMARRPCRARPDVGTLDGVLSRERSMIALAMAEDVPRPDAVRVELDQLTGAGRQTALLLALGLSPADTTTVEDVVASGLARPDGSVPPAVADAVVTSMGPTERVAVHAEAARALMAAGAPAVRVAPHLAGSGAIGVAAAALLVDAARAVISSDPVRALHWLDAAADAGAPLGELAGLRAAASAAAGDVMAAARWAEAAPDDPNAISATAAVLAAAGLARRWAERAARAGRGDEAAVALVVAGDVTAARDASAGAVDAGGDDPPLWVEAAHRMAAGVVGLTGDDPAAAVGDLETAAALVDQLGGGPLCGETPHALAAIAALQLLEPDRARRVLERARASGAGGPLHATRLLLLTGLTHLARGHLAAVRDVADEVAARGQLSQARDRVLAAALAAGLARRGTNPETLAAAVSDAMDALAAVDDDHVNVVVTGEIMAAAARVPRRVMADELRAPPGVGPLQAVHASWWALQIALAAGDTAGVASTARRMATLPLPDPRLAVLVDAAGAWAAVVAGSADGARVIEVAHALAAADLAWEGASLAGAAALRSGDPDGARALLACGRELAVVDAPSGDEEDRLSEREQEVAALVVEGLTHKEIGARLYISAKTVEHHVARIRQKLGATTRAEMLAALRSISRK